MSERPDDADYDAINRLGEEGVDLKEPQIVDFSIAVSDETSANACHSALKDAGFDSRIDYDEGEPDFDPAVDDIDEFGPSWTVIATVRMLLTYTDVVRIQRQLSEITTPFGGIPDGWGVAY